MRLILAYSLVFWLLFTVSLDMRYTRGKEIKLNTVKDQKSQSYVKGTQFGTVFFFLTEIGVDYVIKFSGKFG